MKSVVAGVAPAAAVRAGGAPRHAALQRRAEGPIEMLTHNTYFGGQVQSVGFERNGRKATVGAVDAGEFHFDTGAPERMTVTSGELWARLPGESAWRAFPAGTCFEIPARSGFDVKAAAPASYLCEFL